MFDFTTLCNYIDYSQIYTNRKTLNFVQKNTSKFTQAKAYREIFDENKLQLPSISLLKNTIEHPTKRLKSKMTSVDDSKRIFSKNLEKMKAELYEILHSISH